MADANILKPFVLAWEGGYVFQSTPLREGRLVLACSPASVSSCFNPRPYVRGDKLQLCLVYRHHSFNPRPYVRGDSSRQRARCR